MQNIEVFYAEADTLEAETPGEYLPEGWYWWSCCPGCLPDGDAIGPFETEAEAEEDAQDGLDD